MRGISLFILALFFTVAVAAAEEVPFRQYNPDVDKYDFTRSFITGLSYYSRVAERLGMEDKAELDAIPDSKAIRDFIDHRTLDNADLRIAKNYLVRYFKSGNGLIRRVAIDSAATYQKLLEMSSRERELWKSFERSRRSGAPADFNETEFSRRQVQLASDKKEVAKELVRQANLVTRIMLSAELCQTEDCKELALTRDERDKLVRKLDSFARGSMDWGLKAGQSSLQACTSVLREVLEDPLYHSRPEAPVPGKVRGEKKAGNKI